MSERIRVEVTESVGSGSATFAAEALSGRDAVNAVIDVMKAEEEEFLDG